MAMLMSQNQPTYKRGEAIKVKWGGDWYDGHIVSVQGTNQYMISYDGYSDGWNEVVGPKRLRARGKQQPKQPKQPQPAQERAKASAAASRDGAVRHIEMTWTCSSCEHRNLGRHKTCQQCGNPKDGSEHYEMPADTANAVSVTDADLLRMATAGPDWRCAYCGSDQRKLDGSCNQCGASALTALDTKPAGGAPARRPIKKRTKYVLAALGATGMVIGGATWNARRPRDYDAKVTSVTWEHTIDVERFAIRSREGFKDAMPTDAFDVVSLGDKVHHHDQVPDHMETEYYSVTVPDGYRTESYTERVSCGQDCTTVPETCREKCTTNNNGFATCRTSCSGGGQRCTTRYCNESRTRQVAKTKQEQRSRQVQKYRSEPRYAEGFAFKVWAWQPERTVRAAGTSVSDVRWPDGGAESDPGGPEPHEKERERRSGAYTVTVRYDDDETVKFRLDSPEELARFGPTSKHAVHVEPNVLTVDGKPIQRM